MREEVGLPPPPLLCRVKSKLQLVQALKFCLWFYFYRTLYPYKNISSYVRQVVLMHMTLLFYAYSILKLFIHTSLTHAFSMRPNSSHPFSHDAFHSSHLVLSLQFLSFSSHLRLSFESIPRHQVLFFLRYTLMETLAQVDVPDLPL